VEQPAWIKRPSPAEMALQIVGQGNAQKWGSAGVACPVLGEESVEIGRTAGVAPSPLKKYNLGNLRQP